MGCGLYGRDLSFSPPCGYTGHTNANGYTGHTNANGYTGHTNANGYTGANAAPKRLDEGPRANAEASVTRSECNPKGDAQT
jgi:hypothetical protein